MPEHRVLICEGDPNIRGMISLALMREGVDFDLANDGLEAIRLLDTSAYVAVVVDLTMPQVDGRDILRVIGHLPHPRPAVIVTAPDSSACDVDPLVVTCIARKPRGIIQMLSILAEFAARFEPASGVEESGDGFHRVNEPETGETGDDVGGDRRLRLGRKDR